MSNTEMKMNGIRRPVEKSRDAYGRDEKDHTAVISLPASCTSSSCELLQSLHDMIP
jgi:hypothetical protein